MKDINKTKEQLVAELEGARRQISELEASEAYIKQTADALMESEERFRLIAENSNELILRIQLLPELKYDYVSPSSLNILGYTPEEFYNNSDIGLICIHPEDRVLFKNIKSLAQSDPGKPNILRRIRKDGRVIWTEESFTVIYNDEGKPVAVHVIARDVTERILAEQAMRKSEEKYETLVEKGNDGIVIIQEGIVKFVNPKLTEMTGFSLAELYNKPFIDFIAPESRELVADCYKIRMAAEEATHSYEARIITKNKEVITVESSSSVIEYEGKSADMAIIRDITKRKTAEKNVIEDSNRLDAIIKSLG